MGHFTRVCRFDFNVQMVKWVRVREKSVSYLLIYKKIKKGIALPKLMCV